MTRREERPWSAAVLAVSLTALAGSLIVGIRLDGAAREAITVTDSLREELRSAREDLNRAVRRADSLGSRRRILRAAGRMGYRAPADTEVRFLPELERSTGPDGQSEGSGR